MINLKDLHVKNFQSHKDTRVEFSPNITMFLGESDTGKTSLFRMIELISKNQPRGVAYITAGTTKATGTLTLVNDVEVVRERTKTVNRYVIHNPDGTSRNFEGFGIDVPPDVVEALDHRPIFIDHDMKLDLNFAKQLDGHFLLTENDAAKAKIIDGLAKINVFNIALRKENTKLTNLNLHIRGLEGELGNKKEELKEYEGIEMLGGQIDALDELIGRMEYIENRLEQLNALNQQYQNIQSEIAHNEMIVGKLGNIAEADQILKNVTILAQKKAMLTTLNQQFITNEQQIQENEKTVQMKPAIVQVANLYNEIVTRFNKSEQFKQLHYNYLSVNDSINKGTAYVERISVVKEAEVVLNELTALSKRKEELAYLGNALHNVSNQLEHEQNTVSKLSDIRNVDSYIQQLSEKNARKTQLQAMQTELFNSERNIVASMQEVERATLEVNSAKQNYASALKEMKKCPVCFGELSDTHLDHVVQSL